MRPDVSHIGLAVDTGDGGSCRRPPLGGRTRLVIIIMKDQLSPLREMRRFVCTAAVGSNLKFCTTVLRVVLVVPKHLAHATVTSTI